MFGPQRITNRQHSLNPLAHPFTDKGTKVKSSPVAMEEGERHKEATSRTHTHTHSPLTITSPPCLWADHCPLLLPVPPSKKKCTTLNTLVSSHSGRGTLTALEMKVLKER